MDVEQSIPFSSVSVSLPPSSFPLSFCLHSFSLSLPLFSSLPQFAHLQHHIRGNRDISQEKPHQRRTGGSWQDGLSLREGLALNMAEIHFPQSPSLWVYGQDLGAKIERVDLSCMSLWLTQLVLWSWPDAAVGPGLAP